MKEYRILLVDDNSDSLNSMVKFLERSSDKYNAILALNGKDALNIVSIYDPDLIITDWEMPEMDGIELIKTLKENNETKDIPVILVTGVNTMPEDLKKGFETGAIDYLRKPFNEIEFNSRIKSTVKLLESIKEIKQNKADLEESEKRYKSIAEASSEGIIIYNKSKILDVNQNILNMTDYSKKDLIGSPILDIMEPEHYARIVNDSSIGQYEILCKKKDGSSFSAEIKTKPIVFNNEQAIVLAIRDVTFYKEQLKTIKKQSEAMLEMEKEISSQQVQKLESKLEFKKKELMSNAMFLVQSAQKNTKIFNELESRIPLFKQKNQEMLRSFIQKYKNDVSENFWREFNMRFVEVNKDFYTRLNEKYPELTPGQRKLCALLRLNLSSKEIASITYQETNSINVFRTRLRKVVNIDKDENLITFLEKI